MHFEFLVEDASGKIALETLVEKILGPNGVPHTFRYRAYKGVGHIPKKMISPDDFKNKMLLNNLPRLLRGYGKSLQDMEAAVVVVVDADTRDCVAFKNQLIGLLSSCNPAPMTLFRIAVEEMEAWLLGCRGAVTTAYPKARKHILDGYKQDSVGKTWELLADAIHKGGAAALKKEGWPAPGRAKCEWARQIAPHIDVDANKSPSFGVFRDGIRRLAKVAVGS